MTELYTENLDLNMENSTAEPAPDEEDETLTDYILKQKREAEKQWGMNSGRIYYDENIFRPYGVEQGTITTSNRTVFSGDRTVFPGDYLTSSSISRLNNLTSSMTQTEITATTAQSRIAELENRINELETRLEGVIIR